MQTHRFPQNSAPRAESSALRGSPLGLSCFPFVVNRRPSCRRTTRTLIWKLQEK
uniref:ORF5 protein n=1 Tax=Psittacine aviadenovirus B TaxID=2169709 RepID=A0AB38ZP93_9ADEN